MKMAYHANTFWEGGVAILTSDKIDLRCTEEYFIMIKGSTSQIEDIKAWTYIAKREKAMAPHSSTLAWKIPWTEEPGGLPSMGSHWVGHDWSDLAAAAEEEELKNKQRKINNTITEIKNMVEVIINSRIIEVEEQIRDLEDRTIKITAMEENKGKRMKKWGQELIRKQKP